MQWLVPLADYTKTSEMRAGRIFHLRHCRETVSPLPFCHSVQAKRDNESSIFNKFWLPAFAGMTGLTTLSAIATYGIMSPAGGGRGWMSLQQKSESASYKPAVFSTSVTA